jgi:hypothetical protein
MDGFEEAIKAAIRVTFAVGFVSALILVACGFILARLLF